MKVTAIIPVYNVESYLELCLDTVLSALDDTDEVLLVQGRSTDKSRDISFIYEKKYPQVKMMEQNGDGLSNARNCGLRAATGDIILFIDSDDFVDTNTLTDLLVQIRKSTDLVDVWLTDFYKFFESGGQDKPVCHIGTHIICSLDELAEVMPKHQFFCNVWKNVYRREFLIKNELFFAENTYAEDVDFITRLFLSDPLIRTRNAPFYHYRMGRGGSLMNTASLTRLKDTVAMLENSIQRLRSAGSAWSDPMITDFQFEYLLSLALIQEVEPEKREQAISVFDRYKETLWPATDLIVRCGAFGVKTIGVRGMSKLMWFAKRLKRKREHRIS